MNIFLSESMDHDKTSVLHQVFTHTIQQQGHQVTDNLAEAELVIVFGDQLSANPEFEGKRVFLINTARAFSLLTDSLNTALHKALSQAVEYQEPVKATAETKNIVAVTACPTGVAYTFMAAEAIAEYAKKQGWNIKVEIRGQLGADHLISASDVAAADLVFIAADVGVDLSPFKGKPVYRTSTSLALKNTEQEFQRAFEEASIYQG